MSKNSLLIFCFVILSLSVSCQVLNVGLELNFYAAQFLYATPRTTYTSFNNDESFTSGKFNNAEKPFVFPGLAIQYDFKNDWFIKYSFTYILHQNSSLFSVNVLDNNVWQNTLYNSAINIHFINNAIYGGYKFFRKRRLHLVVFAGINIFTKIDAQLVNLATTDQTGNVNLGSQNDPGSPVYYLYKSVDGMQAITFCGGAGLGVNYRSFYIGCEAITNIGGIDKYEPAYYNRLLMANVNLRYNITGFNIISVKHRNSLHRQSAIN